MKTNCCLGRNTKVQTEKVSFLINNRFKPEQEIWQLQQVYDWPEAFNCVCVVVLCFEEHCELSPEQGL